MQTYQEFHDGLPQPTLTQLELQADRHGNATFKDFAVSWTDYHDWIYHAS